jgi:hypothetical protein
MAIGAMLRFLTHLRERMEQSGFPQTDRLMQTVHLARADVYSLSVAVHYLSCEGASAGSR